MLLNGTKGYDLSRKSYLMVVSEREETGAQLARRERRTVEASPSARFLEQRDVALSSEGDRRCFQELKEVRPWRLRQMTKIRF